MKKLFIVPILCLSLSSCITIQGIETAFKLGTASIANPVTKDRLYQVEEAVTLVFTGLNAWKKTCVQGLINADCKRQIAMVQVFTRELPPYLTQLRTFVKTNDQVNATIVFNNITSLIGTIKSQAAASGQTI